VQVGEVCQVCTFKNKTLCALIRKSLVSFSVLILLKKIETCAKVTKEDKKLNSKTTRQNLRQLRKSKMAKQI